MNPPNIQDTEASRRAMDAQNELNALRAKPEVVRLPRQEPTSPFEDASISNWKPIETAVRDSTARLVWCPERQNIYVVYWRMRHDADDGWNYFGPHKALDEIPTHWMPLPPAPK